MAQSQFSLSWDEHVQNICSGLSLLQQNGEFVDMTLAADGYLVKVHQVIIALSSPFLKDLISSAQCPHPVIILNKISHNTLAAILEYIYTGEVLVAIEDLNELIDAAKDLHIKGLQEMNLSQALTSERQKSPEVFSTQMGGLDPEDDICYFEISNPSDDISKIEQKSCNVLINDVRSINDSTEELYKEPDIEIEDRTEITPDMLPPHLQKLVTSSAEEQASLGTLQYTVSNQGSLQMILNRFIYYLKYTNRDKSRQWRCVDYINNYKCPAYVVTKDDVVVQRISAHNHPFHDKKILKKVKTGAIFSALIGAEKEGTKRKNKIREEHESE
ncbi:unnamed protein product, partial [Brenthis ino]